MAYRSELTTVREMIDAAFVFREDDPVVDFKLLESILYIIARQLNVLRRSVMVTREEIKKSRLNLKSSISIKELKVYKKIAKRTKDDKYDTTTEKFSSFKLKHKRRSSIRQRSKSKGRYEEDDDDDYKKHKLHKYGHDGYDEDYKKMDDVGRHRDGDDQDPRKRGPHRDDESKRQGRKFRDDSRVRDGDDQDSKKRGPHRDDDSNRQGRKFRDDSRDVLHEKILVVSKSSQDGMHDRDHRSAVVTQRQYDEIRSEIRRLQDKFGIVSNIDTSWSNLHRQTSLTDPRAALNMATRLDIAQKHATQMIDIVTKFASAIPGFNMGEVMKDDLVQQIYKAAATSKTPKSITSPTFYSSDLVDQDYLDDILLDEANLATWSEFNANMDETQKSVCQRMASAAAKAAETARRANKLFIQTAPRLPGAAMLNVKFAKCKTLVDRFTNDAAALDAKMVLQTGDCQEIVTQLQFEVEEIVERIEDALVHPAEDPTAVAKIKDEFAILLDDLASANKNQNELKELQDLSDLDLEIIRRKLEMISRNKLTREEALERLAPKARVNDINSILSRDQLYAVVGFMQQEINDTRGFIASGEVRWQHSIEDYITYLNEKADRHQLLTLEESLRKNTADMDARVSTMLDVVGDLPANIYDKKLDRNSNCLSCGTPAHVKVTEENMKLAKRLISRSRPTKPVVIEEKDTEKPCFPGRPIPHDLDPRALVCDRYCGASISMRKESLGLDVVDIDPTHRDMQNRVHLTCTPCTHSEETFLNRFV